MALPSTQPRRLSLIAVAAAVMIALIGAPAQAEPAPAAAVPPALTPEVRTSLNSDTSRDLTAIAADIEAASKAGGQLKAQTTVAEQPDGALGRAVLDPDAATGTKGVQTGDIGTAAFPEFGVNIEGVSNIDGVLPPDTNGDVGPNHYVQMINLHFAVYSKTGALLLGPLANNTLWNGFGGACESHNDGDPVVLYDEAADRWMMSQFALSAPDGHHQCIAISTTPDPTGSWHRYDFFYHASRFNDYPKFGIWPDAYYMSANEFAPAFVGAGAVAFERDKMLLGQPARMVYFHLGPDYGGLLPADAEGLAPPAGAPNTFVNFEDDAWGFRPTDRLQQWDYKVDWTNPAASTFGGAGGEPSRFLETTPFDSNLCNYARQCIPQQGTTARLDAISDRLMFRAAYRNFGSHASVVLNHSVDADGADKAGIRWYELRSTGTGWTIHQQGTYAPDEQSRWMGSASIDVSGNIAIGYSASSSTAFPSIRVAGRLAGDPLGTLAQGERIMHAGTGAQTHSAARWGDYSSMSIDPNDQCTFWFTTEYMAATSSADWKTRIGSTKFPTCSAGPSGTVSGKVTDSANGNAIAGATVTVGNTATATAADGSYSFTLPVGDYTVTASAYGYAAKSAPAAVTDGGTTTVNLALAKLPTVTVSGVVTDGSGNGYPLYARIDLAGRPGGPVFTNPATGAYSVEVAAGATYGFSVRTGALPGYQTLSTQVDVGSGNVTRDLALPVDGLACVAPGYAVNYGSPVLDEPFTTAAGTTPPAGWSVVNRTTGGSWSFDNPKNRGNLTGGTGNFATADSDAAGSGKTQDTDLITPALDMSAVPNPIVRFNSDYRALSSSIADIDYSLDAGATWTNVWKQTTTSRRGPRVEEVAVPAIGGQSAALLRFRYRGTFAWWWQVDNVQLLNRSCDAQPGGLVTGFVTDANTSKGLIGAKVASDDRPTDVNTTLATPDDQAIGDGLYWVYSNLVGSHGFTATKAPYLAGKASVNVAENGTVRQDFALAAGRVEVTPGSVSASVPWNGSATRTVTVRNTGNAPASVELLERDGDFEMLAKTGARLLMQRVKHATLSDGMTGTPAEEIIGAMPAVDDAWTAIKPYPGGPVMDNSAVWHDGKIYSFGANTGAANYNRSFVFDPVQDTWTALANMPTGRAKASAVSVGGKIYLIGGWAATGVPIPSVDVFDPATGTWSTLSGVTNPKPVSAGGAAVVDGKIYIVGGCLDGNCAKSNGTVVFNPVTSEFSLGANYPVNAGWMGCGAISGKVYCAGGNGAAGTLKSANVYNPATDTWSALPDLPIDLWGSAHAASGGLLVLMGGVTSNGAVITNRTLGFDPAANEWLNLPNNLFTRYRGGAACDGYKIGGSSGGFTATPDSEVLGGLGDCASAVDVPWMSASPTELALAPGESRTVTVSLTAQGRTQPGTFTAQFGVATDTPYAVEPIGVSMQVAPPVNWGKLAGTLLGKACAGTTTPLKGVVRIRSHSDPSFNVILRTDAQGAWAYWVPTGSYDVIVSSETWIPDTEKTKVTKGKTTVVNFTLDPVNPCPAAGPQAV